MTEQQRPYRSPETRTPDPNRFFESRGREIQGLPSRSERFSRLDPDTDIGEVSVNPTVESAVEPARFSVFVNPSNGTEALTVHAPHWRAVDAGRGTFIVRGRKKGTGLRVPFYVANVKGCGFLKPTLEAGNLEQYETWFATKSNGANELTVVLGMAMETDLTRFAGVMSDAQYLTEQGMRCEVYWSVSELRRVPFRGEMHPVEDLWERKVIPQGARPYQAVRLFRMNTRVEEAKEGVDRRADIFQEAFDTFNRETDDRKLTFARLDVARIEDRRVFFTEFFRRIGTNLAVLINSGFSHSHLHASNVTMAAEFADLESLEDIRRPSSGFKTDHSGLTGGVDRLVLKDMRDAAYSCRILLRAANKAGYSVGDTADFASAAMEGFDAALRSNKLLVGRNIPVDRSAAVYWIRNIFEKVIVKNESLVSLLDGQVADWGIPFPDAKAPVS